MKDKMDRLLIECSGPRDSQHNQEDFLKLLECTSACLPFDMMNYRYASLDTFKRRHIYAIQAIGSKITLGDQIR
ncbi:hypothetical protein DFQ28_003722 [Apophysomyces sp. BC1034]|nr:hypothetical protein DFQ30_004062 [Apophysomyces sp. BC1015]KAG0180544.1 hypothetical protein DFQ29_000497 [Apophysomyces sp. BC1021]KAG0189204.1 hypothetical protein DFQ28_003722 [Apophysomyces sp. BC1034]